MIISTLQLSLFFSFLASYLAEDPNGHHVRPDTAPEKDLLPAIQFRTAEAPTRSTHHHTNHHMHHRHDFYLPTPGGANMEHTPDYYDYQDYITWRPHTELTADYGEYSESGDYGTKVVFSDEDDEFDSTHDHHTHSAVESRYPSVLLLAVMISLLFMHKLN